MSAARPPEGARDAAEGEGAPVSDSPPPIVIVGAGQAAARAAHALRELGHQSPIVVVGAEAHHPYERPPLSKGLLCDAVEPDTAVLPQAQFDACDLQFIAGVRVLQLDAAARSLQLSDGRTLAYTQCLLATGGHARVLPALPPGTPRVHYLRSLDDARRLRAALEPGTHLAVIGGGFLGLETAASAVRRGARVTVVETATSLLARFVPHEVSQWLAEDVRRRGVQLRLGQAVAGAEAHAQGVRITLGNGELVQADHVLVAIGLVPHAELAQAAGLAIDPRNGGIAVDASCRTSDPHVFAAGDCASQFNPHLGEQLRLESWQNANEQGRAAASAMLGQALPVPPYPWFWTDQGEHNLQMLGMAAPDLVYVRRGDLALSTTAPKALWLGLRNGVAVHGIALNAGTDLRAVRALFEQGTTFDPAGFTDLATPLRTWVKATQALAASSSTSSLTS